MEFEENDIAITLPEYKKEFIYFLLKNNVVVYVGQTKKQGIKRPLSHNDKDYDKIKIIYYETDKIDYMEDYFIKKYKPKYNKVISYSQNYSLLRARNTLRKLINNDNITIATVKKYIKKYNIKTFKIGEKIYIDIINFKKLVKEILNEMGEKYE